MAGCHFAWSMASIMLTDTVRQLGYYPRQPLRFCLLPLVSLERKILVIMSDQLARCLPPESTPSYPAQHPG